MGLDISHDCFSGSYNSFLHWRQIIAEVAGLPPLNLMEGFYEPFDCVGTYSNPSLYPGMIDKDKISNSLLRIDEQLPIKWECLKKSAIHQLLHHSDCEGKISWKKCEKISQELEKLVPALKEKYNNEDVVWVRITEKFINGLKLAVSKKESIDFH